MCKNKRPKKLKQILKNFQYGSGFTTIIIGIFWIMKLDVNYEIKKLPRLR